jgi:hypothetical protein
MREKHNVTKRNVATINLQLYNAPTEASDVAMVCSCGTTELHKAANWSFSCGVGPLMWDHWTAQGSQLKLHLWRWSAHVGPLNCARQPTKASLVSLVRSCGTTELRKAANWSFSCGVGPLMWDYWTAQGSQLMENYSVVKFNPSQRVFQ